MINQRPISAHPGRLWLWATTAQAVGFLVMSCCLCQVTTAGEWMFRLKDAHIQLRKAMRTRDGDLAWECVNRHTRQEAGLLAAQIRNSADGLPEEKKTALMKALGIAEQNELEVIQGKDVLVAPFFIDAHPYLLAPDRDETRLKEHGTRMALPTAIVVNKNTAEEKLIEYTFSTEGHFGGQAMDYRAQLEIPSLEKILGKPAEMATPPEEEISHEALVVFAKVRDALQKNDVGTLWPLLDCVSQSQASHFVDQAHEQAGRKKSPELTAEKLGISVDELKQLDGKHVWSLPWAKQDLKFLVDATNAEYLPAEKFDPKLLPVPEGYQRRYKPGPSEPVIQFQSQGRSWHIPARLNYRDGTPQVTLFLRAPYYLRLRK